MLTTDSVLLCPPLQHHGQRQEAEAAQRQDHHPENGPELHGPDADQQLSGPELQGDQHGAQVPPEDERLRRDQPQQEPDQKDARFHKQFHKNQSSGSAQQLCK